MWLSSSHWLVWWLLFCLSLDMLGPNILQCCASPLLSIFVSHRSMNGISDATDYYSPKIKIVFLELHAQKNISPPPLNRWQVQRKVVAIPKSVTPARIQQNVQVSLTGGKEFWQCPFMWVIYCPTTCRTLWPLHTLRRESKIFEKQTWYVLSNWVGAYVHVF